MCFFVKSLLSIFQFLSSLGYILEEIMKDDKKKKETDVKKEREDTMGRRVQP